MSELKKTFWHAGIYTIGIILNRAVSFVMLPVYTRFLTPSDYGILELLEATLDIVSIIAGLGILAGLSKFYYSSESEDDKKGIVSTVFILIISFYSVGCFLGVLSSPFISELVFKTREYTYYVRITFVNLFLQILFAVPAAFIRTEQRSAFFVGISSVNLLLQLFLNILFLVHMHMGVRGVLYSTLLSSFIMGSVLTLYTFRKVGLRFSPDKARRLMRFGYPFVFTGLAAFITTFSDRYFLNFYRDVAEVGIYSLAYKFGFLLMTFPVRPLLNIWNVQRFEVLAKGEYEQTFNRFLAWFCVITLSVALLISMAVRDVLVVMAAPSFWTAHSIVPIIVFAYFFQACTDFFNFGIYQSGRTKHAAYGTVLAAVVIVGLSFLLIPRFGAMGAAWATLISFFVRLLYFYHASQRLFRIRYRLASPIGTTFIAVSIYLLYAGCTTWFPAMNRNLVSVPVIFLLFMLFPLSLIMMNVIKHDELRSVLNLIRSPIKSFSELRNSQAP